MRNKKMTAVVYLSVESDMRQISYKEEKQLRYIREYAKAHKIEIVKIVHRDVLGVQGMNIQIGKIIKELEAGLADVLLIAKSSCIASDVCQIYHKAGLIAKAGAKLITVKEGTLNLPIKMVV